jgi:RHS repeat-associated protein
MAVVDPTSQTVKTGYGYSPFGTTFKSNNNSNNNLLFTGRELDLGSSVYYFRGRYYNTSFQRFLSEDPIGFAGGDTNLYRYGGNNPLIGGDPTGLAFDLSVSSGSPGNSGISISSDPGGFFDFFNYVPGGQPIPSYNMPAPTSTPATGQGNHGVPVLLAQVYGVGLTGSASFGSGGTSYTYGVLIDKGLNVSRFESFSVFATTPQVGVSGGAQLLTLPGFGTKNDDLGGKSFSNGFCAGDGVALCTEQMNLSSPFSSVVQDNRTGGVSQSLVFEPSILPVNAYAGGGLTNVTPLFSFRPFVNAIKRTFYTLRKSVR